MFTMTNYITQASCLSHHSKMKGNQLLAPWVHCTPSTCAVPVMHQQSICTCFHLRTHGGPHTYPAQGWNQWSPETRTTHRCFPYLKRTGTNGESSSQTAGLNSTYLVTSSYRCWHSWFPVKLALPYSGWAAWHFSFGSQLASRHTRSAGGSPRWLGWQWRRGRRRWVCWTCFPCCSAWLPLSLTLIHPPWSTVAVWDIDMGARDKQHSVSII